MSKTASDGAIETNFPTGFKEKQMSESCVTCQKLSRNTIFNLESNTNFRFSKTALGKKIYLSI